MNLRQRIKLRYNNNRACNANIGAAIGNIVQQMEEIRYIVRYIGVPFFTNYCYAKKQINMMLRPISFNFVI